MTIDLTEEAKISQVDSTFFKELKQVFKSWKLLRAVFIARSYYYGFNYDLKTKKRSTLIIWFSWMCISGGFYGLTLNAKFMSGNIFINFLYLSLVDIAANILIIVLAKFVPRRFLLRLRGHRTDLSRESRPARETPAQWTTISWWHILHTCHCNP